MSTCRSCGAPIEWARIGEKAIPLDVGTVDDGNLEVLATMPDGSPVVHRLEHGEAPMGPRRRSHFATCPQAGEWRRR
jgi:hypothetical protein